MVTDFKNAKLVSIGKLGKSDEPDKLTTVYFLASGQKDIVHYGELAGTQEVVTGQPALQLYKLKADWEKALADCGIILEGEVKNPEDITEPSTP